MELFTLLEERVIALCKEVRFLREENTMLEASFESLSELREENLELRKRLEKEKNLCQQVAKQVDNLLVEISRLTGGV